MELIDADRELELLGWRLRDLWREGRSLGPATISAIGFPPDRARPNGDSKVVPTTRRDESTGQHIGEVEVVVGIRASAVGVFRAEGVRVTYEQDSQEHQLEFPLTMEVCSVARGTPPRCPSTASTTP